MILTPTQKLLWEQKWRDLCEHAALQNLERQPGDPLFGASIPQLMGTDPMADPCLQACLDPDILRLTVTLALQATLRIPETGKPTLSFTKVQQGVSEPYMQCIDRLHDALDKETDNREAKDALLQKLAVENTNTDCKKVLQPLPMNTTLVQMTEVCNQVGSIDHHTESLASAFAAALTISQDPRGQKKCCRCGDPGHLVFACPGRGQGGNSPAVPPALCPRCGTGRHGASRCRSQCNADGQPLPPRRGNGRRGAGRGRAAAPAPPAPGQRRNLP